MTNKTASMPGDSLTLRDEATLGRYRYLGLLRYKDIEAGYCNACSMVYGVECPNCHAKAGDHLRADPKLFLVDRPLETDRFQGQSWTKVECAKCSYQFKVLIQPIG